MESLEDSRLPWAELAQKDLTLGEGPESTSRAKSPHYPSTNPKLTLQTQLQDLPPR